MSGDGDEAGALAMTGAGAGVGAMLAVAEPEPTGPGLTTTDWPDSAAAPPPAVPPAEPPVGFRWIRRTTMMGLDPDGAAAAAACPVGTAVESSRLSAEGAESESVS
ncbi:MAG: hypothetical protein EDR02_16540 [Actinobacteria bacterium]|nr:MAG: hypothetical protein EDR02_16540 [Actinomycetota bacterium]RIK08399.1 MAG: hypothetical protein DCC48_00145 [Acidobacteriota bacterium]